MLLTSAGLATTPYIPLGLNYTEWGPYVAATGGIAGAAQHIWADNSGALYILSLCATGASSCLTKLSADGATIVWQKTLAFTTDATAMAVDPNGGVYLSVPNGNTLAVEKLGLDGSVLWTTQGAGGLIAVDATGRVFAAGLPCGDSPGLRACVIRLNTSGAIDATFPNMPLSPTALAVDPTGSYIALLDGAYEPEAVPQYSLAWLTPGSTTWLAANPPLSTISPGFAVAPNGDMVVYGSDIDGNRSLQRISPTGAVVFSEAIPSQMLIVAIPVVPPGNLALDAAGNAYITEYTGAFPILSKNSLAPCVTAWLGVYAPDGSALQITYLPGATNLPWGGSNTIFVYLYGLVAVGPGGAVFVLDSADTTFTPTQTGPFPQFPYGTQSGSSAFYSLSPNANAQTLPLSCVANAASFSTGAVAPGEEVALYGNNLGPQQGVQTSGTLQSPFPTQAAGVEVTFDGTPAPLLWMQDSQVNVAVPWSVAGPTTQICVTYNNVKTNCLTWPVAQAAPGVFTVDGVHAVALNQDGTLNSASNPAPPNTIVSVWATGLGPITPPQPDGSLVASPLPVNAYPVTLQGTRCLVSCGGPGPFDVHPATPATGYRSGLVPLSSPAPITYAGPAPLLIAGTSQINFNASIVSLAPPGGGFPLAAPWVIAVQTPSGGVVSNSFLIY